MIENKILKKYDGNNPRNKNGFDLKCLVCGKSFYKKKVLVEAALSDKKLKAFFCSTNCKHSEAGTIFYKRQLDNNYGIENNFQREESKIKSKKTCLEKYGKEFACQSKQVIEKIKDSNLKSHGYSSPQKNPEIKKKTLETVKEKYGDLVGCMPRIKTEETNMKKYGSKYFFSSEAGKMTDENLKNNYGWTDEELIKRREKQIKAFRSNGRSSSLNDKFEKFLIENKISFSKEYQMITEEKRFYYYDFKIKNTIIEINGDYWHANPEKYEEEDVFYVRNSEVKARDIWKKDFDKIRFAKSKGYDVIVIWESEIKNNENIFEDILKL